MVRLNTVVAGIFISGIFIAGCAHKSGTTAGKTGSKELIRSQYAAKELTQLCDQAIDATNKKLDALSKEKFEGSQGMVRFEETLSDLAATTDPLSFMSSVSPDADLRKESEECKKKASQFFIAAFARRDMYDIVRKAKTTTADEKRLQKEMLIAFEKQGLKLSDKVVAEVKELMQKLSDLRSTFHANLANDNSFVAFTVEELAGTPADFLARLTKDSSGKYIVHTQYPNYLAIMENATNNETRRKMAIAFQTRQKDKNSKLLEEALVLRQKIARKLGYSTWADYNIKGRMAKNEREVVNFLNDLRGKLSKASREDLARLLKMKKKMHPSATHLDPWDLTYFENQLKKQDYALDAEKVREYFPAEQVIKGTFDVYSKLLGVEFVEEKPAKPWSKDVKLFAIRDGTTKETIAYFYADMIPREGKYGHAAAFQLATGRMKDGKYVKPVSALVTNFQPPSRGKPSLLSHDEVETFFHEFGHIMHMSLTKASYGMLAGANVYQDFVEAPSQMLENWVWDKDVLASLSGHYTDTSKKLPDEMLQKMLNLRFFNKGYFYMRQLVLGTFDIRIHSAKGPVNTKVVYDKIYRDYLGIKPITEAHFPATFGHLMGGYDAGYYGYLWSQVYAQDMFSRFKKEGLLNPQTGLAYRKTILEPGDMREPMELLTQFLGRKPNNSAFLKMIESATKKPQPPKAMATKRGSEN